MIINSLRAENVLKYARLELRDIPGRGLIAIVGDNESGKSTLGESICFALFGRTYSLGPEDLVKVIRWGETRCYIKLDFTTPDGQRYQIARFLDELGNYDASLTREGEAPMIQGVEEVAQAIEKIIGFGYNEFIESFYLAQREISTPHPHSDAVKAMAGVEPLENAAERCRVEIEEARELARKAGAELAEVRERIDALDLQKGHLESLRRERAGHEKEMTSDQARITELEKENEEGDRLRKRLREGAGHWLQTGMDAPYRKRREQQAKLEELLAALRQGCGKDENTAKPLAALSELAGGIAEKLDRFDGLRGRAAARRERHLRLLGEVDAPAGEGEQTFREREQALEEEAREPAARRITARRLSWLFLVLALVGWGAAGLLGLAPGSSAGQTLAAWLAAPTAEGQAPLQPWLIGGASLLTVLFLVFLVRSVRFGTRLRELDDAREQLRKEQETAAAEAERLARLDDLPLAEAVTTLTTVGDESLAAEAGEFASVHAAALVKPEAYDFLRKRFTEVHAALEKGLAVANEARRKALAKFDASIVLHSGEMARLDGEIAVEEGRVRQHGELEARAGDLRSRIDELEHRIRVRETAIGLLDGAIHYVSQRFNTEVRELAADSLPMLTNGRYEHLQIDENLNVKAFSSEKRNFMDLDEISSGTQRQIMLAVRLALSQKLVNSVIKGPQMLFLDEPFAFFDEVRTASALAVLPKVSGDFTQIWITSQRFPPHSRFDLYIRCEAGEGLTPQVERDAGATETVQT